jgi:broad specificity phosphatase PhoE
VTTRLLLIRHGETDAVATGRTQGRRDVPLNARGREQAAALGAWLRSRRLAAVIASSSTRCLDTASAVAAPHALAVRVDERLVELDQGVLDGLTADEMRAAHADFLRRWRSDDPSDLRMPEGETMREAQARLVAATRAIASEFPGAEVAVVSHNLALKALLCHAFEIRLAGFRRMQLDVASLTVVDARLDTSWTVLTMNERCHITRSKGDA